MDHALPGDLVGPCAHSAQAEAAEGNWYWVPRKYIGTGYRRIQQCVQLGTAQAPYIALNRRLTAGKLPDWGD
ncbi:MAG TPA: hypothetical protein VMG82_26000 [Candidatus Sulfotelmatobacter sp.]|nr:hypothetical protein [Candidatus Sulfotelmatobacter sp.]